ncbi:peptidoglycan-binding domain-containing protein [Streptomyces sp. HNM0574]|uniref:peptidoglycan-binding protein n=1 Tax=Streptomyces sp. HNM0574 TaxID=2714954 RepID=UPI00146C28F8|nr:peptidoglycan-binding domain-containing protein [Streptomyces sp. HNM0574]NLU70965.1 peptidoglycan-binding protein [Streptomyces sp. HNM0574]
MRRRLVVRVGLGVLLVAGAGSAGAAERGNGLRRFQVRHGLPATGRVDRRTAAALGKASDAEMDEVFRTAEDLGPEQRAHARRVIGVGKGAGIPGQGQVIALMTAMQESRFVNHTTPLDNDSLGIFQQRPGMGWGTPEELTDVVTASKLFYGVAPDAANPGLLQISGWRSMPPGDACQAVQRSSHPGRYAQWEEFARELLATEGPSADPVT